MESIAGSADHLVVLVHGLWGNPSHLSYLASTLRKAYDEDELHILLVKSNADSFTYDGIELGGERVTHEVEAEINKLEETGRKINKLSFVGYSLGGLVARYAIGLLYSNGWFDRIQPVNFTTFATPHLGVRAPKVGPQSYIWNVLGARTLSTSGRQLFLIDSFRQTGQPLLSVMAEPKSVFIRGLAAFENRSLYANTLNDRSVPYYTACIARTDPFVDISVVELNPLADTDGVILDPIEPVRTRPLTQTSLLERIRISGTSTIKSIPFFLLLGVLIPIGSVIFLANSGIQTFRSAQRVKLHEAGKTGIGLERYRAPLLIEEAKSLSDRVYRRLGQEQGEDYLPAEDEERTVSTRPSSMTNGNTHNGGPKSEQKASERHIVGQFKGTERFPTLALNDAQFRMIENLDNVGWSKYPVHIDMVRHTHAAIIVRIKRKSFEQGKVVVGHWIKQFQL